MQKIKSASKFVLNFFWKNKIEKILKKWAESSCLHVKTLVPAFSHSAFTFLPFLSLVVRRNVFKKLRAV